MGTPTPALKGSTRMKGNEQSIGLTLFGETQYAMAYAQRFLGHSEPIVGNGLLDMGVQPSQVTAIYTEFAPCNGCATYLQGTFPQVPVSYSFSFDAAGKLGKAATFSGVFP